MKNTILSAIINLKRSFIDSANRQQNIITSIIDENSILLNQTVTTGSGIAYNIAVEQLTGLQRQLNITKLTDQGSVLINVLSDMAGEFDLNTLLPELDISVNFDLGDLLSDIQSTMDFNTVIAQASGMFMTTRNASVDMLFKYIESSTNVASNCVNQFKQIISSNCPDGTISQFKYLKILEAIMDQGKQDVESGSLKMDTNSPYFIANAIATVLKTVMSVLADVLSAVLTVIGGIIGIIANVVINLAKTIWGAISSQVNTTVSVTDEAISSNLYDGALEAAYVYNESWHNKPHFVGLDDVHKCRQYNFGPLTSYWWAASEVNGTTVGVNVNSFLTMDLHPERTMSYLLSNGIITVDSSEGWGISKNCYYCKNSEDINNFWPDECYLTAEEQLNLQTDSQKVCAYTGFNLALLGFMHERAMGGSKLLQLQTWWNWSTYSITHNYEIIYYLFHQFLSAAICYDVYGSLDNWFNAFTSDSSIGERFTDVAMSYVQSQSETYETIRNMNPGPYAGNDGFHSHFGYMGPTNPISFYYTLLAFVFARPVGAIESVVNLQCDQTLYLSDELDAIPQARGYKFATARWGNIITALAIAAGVLTAGILAFTVGRVKMKKWGVEKQNKEWAKLQNSRNKWIDHDTGAIIGDQADYDAYYKQMKKYNRKARLFGWGSYDASNNWNNAPDTPSVDVSAATSGLATSDVLNDLTDDGQINLSSLRSDIQGSNESTIDDVITLIRGY